MSQVSLFAKFVQSVPKSAAFAATTLSLAFLAASAGPAQAEIDQDWINDLPGGKNITIDGKLTVSGSTAQGKAKINDKVVEIAAGTLKNGQVVMWQVKGLKLSTLYNKLDVFPFNEISMPDALMVLAHGNIKSYRVDQLPVN